MSKNIAIIHPDLGIGGAEQLIVNMALALQDSGHRVTIYTPHHDPQRAFSCTVDGGLRVEVRGSLWPRSILGKCIAFCSLVRMLLACIHVALFAGRHDYIIVDQVSAVLPVFWITRAQVVFYCHFPDKLLCTDRGSFLKKLYRWPLDKAEEWGIRTANKVYVNSEFTRNIVEKQFPSLHKLKLDVLYPSIELSYQPVLQKPSFLKGKDFFVSLNRYERKKTIEKALIGFSQNNFSNVSLVIGGGYDPRLPENVEYFNYLTELAQKNNLSYCVVENWEDSYPDSQVYFLKNLSNSQKEQVLQKSVCCLYTPENGK